MSADPAYDQKVSPVLGTPPGPVLLLGATGTIGRAVLKALLEAGLEVTCVLRHAPRAELGFDHPRLNLRIGDMASDAFWQETVAGISHVVSCLASRSGAPDDAWAVDYGINSTVLGACKAQCVEHFVLLSAICVQRPKLAFQKAKLAFETELIASGLSYSIVRPTAFFKSLSGQLRRVQAGKSFLVFGDGTLTACKPISDADLARFILRCLTEPACRNRVLPVGGPGPALTPMEQGALLFEALGQVPKVRRVPVTVLSGIIGLLQAVGMFSQKARDKAELVIDD